MPESPHLSTGLAELVLDVARVPATDCDPEALTGRICVELAELCGLAGCAAIILDAATGAVRGVAGSHAEAEQLARLVHQLGTDAEHAALRGGRPSPAIDLTQARTVLAEAAGRVGLPVTAALPLRAGGELVGCLRLFSTGATGVSERLLRALAPLADVLGVALHDALAYRHSATVVDELSAALDAQRPIEQAKGLLAERHEIDLDAAYRMLRDQARRRNCAVAEVAAEVVRPTWRASAGPERPIPERPAPERPMPEQRAVETEPHHTG